MMKKLIGAALGMILSLSAFAQMMPDSTFQVVAYWDQGDKISYECKVRNVRILPDGTENEQFSTSDVRTFEVIDQTDTSYTLRMSYSDVSSTQLSEGLESDIFSALWCKGKVDFLTDQLGTMQRFLNWDQMLEEAAGNVPGVVDEISSSYKKKDLKELGFDREQWIERFSAMFNGDVLYSAIEKDIVPFFYYHGIRLDPKQEYVIEKEYPEVIGSQSLNADMHFWVDEEKSDSVAVVIFSHAEADGESLIPTLRDAALSLLRARLSPEEYEESAPVIMLQFDKSQMSITFSEDTGTLIDLGSGWPVQYFSEIRVTIKAADGTSEVLTTVNIEYQDPEETSQ